MVKKGFHIPGIIILLLLIIHPVFGQNEVIGVVSNLKGNLIHKLGNREQKLETSFKIYSNSIIQLEENSGTGLLEIITASGPIQYSRFPVSGFVQFQELNIALQDNYITALGGEVLGLRGDEEKELTNNDEYFEWFTELGSLEENQAANGLLLFFSNNKSTKENLCSNPIYFKLNEDINIIDVQYKILKKTEGLSIAKGKFINHEEGLAFSFNSFAYETDTEYLVECYLTLSNGDMINWEFVFTLAGEEYIESIEKKYESSLTGSETEFQKEIIRASVFQSNGMKIKALDILVSQGISPDNIF